MCKSFQFLWQKSSICQLTRYIFIYAVYITPFLPKTLWVLTSVYMMVIRNPHFFTLRLKKWEVTYLKYFVVIVLSSFFIFQVLVSFLLLPLIVPIQINDINYDTITGWTLLVEKFQRKKINPLTPMRDQNTISPSSLNTISGRQVMWIKKNIN